MIDEMAECIARAFHEAYENLAPSHGYETRRASAVPWPEVPERNRRLMVATVRALLDSHAILIGPEILKTSGSSTDSRKGEESIDDRTEMG